MCVAWCPTFRKNEAKDGAPFFLGLVRVGHGRGWVRAIPGPKGGTWGTHSFAVGPGNEKQVGSCYPRSQRRDLGHPFFCGGARKREATAGPSTFFARRGGLRSLRMTLRLSHRVLYRVCRCARWIEIVCVVSSLRARATRGMRGIGRVRRAVRRRGRGWTRRRRSR